MPKSAGGVIRRARPGDVPAIAAIYNESVGERTATADTQPRSLEDRQEWFRQFDDRHPIWVGVDREGDEGSDGRVVSYGCLFDYSPKDGYRFATEHSVYVAASVRGRGLGAAMLDHVLAEAARLGFKYILARIFTHNDASVGLHAARGFKELGIQRRIVEMDGRWYDVTLMDRQL